MRYDPDVAPVAADWLALDEQERNRIGFRGASLRSLEIPKPRTGEHSPNPLQRSCRTPHCKVLARRVWLVDGRPPRRSSGLPAPPPRSGRGRRSPGPGARKPGNFGYRSGCAASHQPVRRRTAAAAGQLPSDQPRSEQFLHRPRQRRVAGQHRVAVRDAPRRPEIVDLPARLGDQQQAAGDVP